MSCPGGESLRGFFMKSLLSIFILLTGFIVNAQTTRMITVTAPTGYYSWGSGNHPQWRLLNNANNQTFTSSSPAVNTWYVASSASLTFQQEQELSPGNWLATSITFNGATMGNTPIELTVGQMPSSGTATPTIKNNTSSPMVGYVTKNGQIVSSKVLQPGESWTPPSLTYGLEDKIGWGTKAPEVIGGLDGTGNYMTVLTNYDNPIVDDYGSNYMGNNTYSITNSNPNSTPWQSATNGQINFTGTSSTAARDDTLKAGFNTLAANQKLQLAQGQHLIEAVNGIQGGSSGAVTVNLTNNFTDSNIVNSINSLHNSLTNFSTNTGWQNFITNDVAGYYGDAKGHLDTVKANLTGPTVADSSSLPSMVAAMGGWNFDFSPGSHGLAPLFETAKALFKWLLVAAFLTKIIKDAMEFVKTMASAQQITFPQVNVIGNTLGAIAIPVIVVVILGAMGIALATITSSIVSHSDLFSIFNTNPLGSASAVGLQLANAFFPFATLFSLVVAYAIYRVTMTTAATVVVFVIRGVIGG